MTVTTTISSGRSLYIAGHWQSSSTTESRVDRWTGEVIGEVAAAGRPEAVAAVDAAFGALDLPFSVPERSRVLAATADIVAEAADDFATMITRETGKPISAARLEVSRAVGTLRYSAEEARRLPGEAVPLDAVDAGANTMAFTITEPLGVVAAITPFNFPLNLVVHKLGPAIAAGCSVVFKPSDRSPLVAAMVVHAFESAGLPAGRLNLVTGPPADIVDATFTGSSDVGWRIKAASPRKQHILELGSNTAMYVHRDADLVRAASDAIAAGFGNTGQACVSLQRLYVHSAVAEPFVEALTRAAASVQAGDPRDAATVVGPMITAAAADRVQAAIASAVRRGARVLVGGARSGDVISATVLSAVPADDPLLVQEVFGPVIVAIEVDGLQAALAAVNSSDYGLNAAIHTADLAAAMTFGRQAQAGSVLVNLPPSFRADHMPYGGVKSSGQGREGVKYAVEELVHRKLIVLKP
jgi:acyl-CoA reductase-like NAD-dependent aldehyde dehydrogenase